MSAGKPRIALFFAGFSTGGVPRVMLGLAGGLTARGYPVDLVVVEAPDAADRPDLPEGVRLVCLWDRIAWFSWRRIAWKTRHRALLSVAALVDYLRESHPAVLLAGGNYVNRAAVKARKRAGVPLRLVVSHHAAPGYESRGKPLVRWSCRHDYPQADAVVAVSEGVADDLARTAGLSRNSLTTIYNPVVAPDIADKAKAPLEHRWFEEGREMPVILAAGRFRPQKDFPTLLRAFALLRKDRIAKLVVLGTGSESARRALTNLALELEIADAVDFAGYEENPYRFMSRADLFVLSSAWEGFGNVLVEAMACGTPVVSTDCPSGPAEILDNGAYGMLVPVGDERALAQAMQASLLAAPDPAVLKERARAFSVDAATERYLGIFFPDEPAARRMAEDD